MNVKRKVKRETEGGEENKRIKPIKYKINIY